MLNLYTHNNLFNPNLTLVCFGSIESDCWIATELSEC